MVETVQAFKAKDGKTFDTLEEATEYENKLEFKEKFMVFFDENYKGEKISMKIKTNVINFISENISAIKEF